MSLIGIDVGTSAVKIGVYSDEGKSLVVTRVPVKMSMERPGWQELNPLEVWSAVCDGLKKVMQCPDVRRDSPTALSISASGDEVFPVDGDGAPLTNCILSGDTRGSLIAEKTLHLNSHIDWYTCCGHVPRNMDPVNRLELYREYHPEAMANARYFLGWHEFLTLRLTGHPITDPTLAAKWLNYDLSLGDWSSEWTQQFKIDVEKLPRVLTWGCPIGEIKGSLARDLGLPKDLTVGTGSYDTTCSALGSGVIQSGELGLACGSWQALVAPINGPKLPHTCIVGKMPIVPYISQGGYALLAQNANGSAVIDWVLRVTGTSHQILTQDLLNLRPSTVLGIPHLSGGSDLWGENSVSRGVILGATLATSKLDIVQAFLEGVAYELVLTTDLLRQAGVETHCLRASGGGTKIPWWLQLKADLTGIPIFVLDQPEPGTFGAALLAGMATGVYKSLSDTSCLFQSIMTCYEPNPHRLSLHSERFHIYKHAVQTIDPIQRRLLLGER